MRVLHQIIVKNFQREILSWYAKNKRDLPWRRDRDPYHIMVSEIMLQQTQVPRVIPKYEAWLKQFPTVKSLANAKTADILSLWSGLGYNRRALYLQKAASIIVACHSRPDRGTDLVQPQPKADSRLRGKDTTIFPKDEKELQKLPGIGEYTARAIACFAFDKQTALVDTNIRKVVTLRFFNGNPPDYKTLQHVANQLLPKGRAYEWNQALMDYSAAMLTKDKIPIPKQSKFIGSNRYYRGQIIKLLVAKGSLTKDELTKMIPIDVNALVAGLKKDQLIKVVGDSVSLP